jgi:hypothetical protein
VLYQAPQCVEGTLNVFFTCPMAAPEEMEKPIFSLHCVPIDLAMSSYEVGTAKHVYDIEEEYRFSLQAYNLNKECYLLNLGWKIMLFKRGYMVDSVCINHKEHNTFLRYFSDRKVIFVGP